jgi:cell division protein FtsB
MSEPIKASRATIRLGSLSVDGFMLPDGSYRMSQTQAAECVDMTERNAREFLDSKTFKRLTGEGYTTAIFEIESETQARGQSRFRALPLEVVVIYWVYQCYRGNKQAFNLLVALATESLERRFDVAFNVTRTEEERNDRLTQRIQQLESDIARLGEAFAMDDEIRRERDYFEQLLRERGIEPWSG